MVPINVELATKVIELLGESALKPFTHHMGNYNDIKFSMEYLRIPADHEVHMMVTTIFKGLGYAHINGLRLNVFQIHDYIDKHIDTAFPGCDTFIMSVVGKDRLKLYSEPAYQDSHVTILHEGTPHEIIRHPEVRISLCGWVSMEKQ